MNYTQKQQNKRASNLNLSKSLSVSNIIEQSSKIDKYQQVNFSPIHDMVNKDELNHNKYFLQVPVDTKLNTINGSEKSNLEASQNPSNIFMS